MKSCIDNFCRERYKIKEVVIDFPIASPFLVSSPSPLIHFSAVASAHSIRNVVHSVAVSSSGPGPDPSSKYEMPSVASRPGTNPLLSIIASIAFSVGGLPYV